MPLDVNIRGIRDSKALNAVEREEVFAELVRHPKVAYSTCVRTRLAASYGLSSQDVSN